jgi:GNAT superfamily N-acetyltransferase
MPIEPHSPQNLELTMVREHLNELPDYQLPAGYSIRAYQPGDEPTWVQIQALADQYNEITAALFTREFGRDPHKLAARQLYLCDPAGNAVGTATAWSGRLLSDQPVGRIHWVAVVPEQQGQGLAKPLMAATCRRLQALGHERAYLTTSTARVPAINLYLRFGFQPLLGSGEAIQAWRAVQPRLKYRPDISTGRELR